jgi:hypothetical protein
MLPGLAGSSPRRIPLVRVGHTWPTPGTMPKAASSNHHGRRLVSSDLPQLGRQRLLPMLLSPLRRICRIDCHDRQSGSRGHDDQPPTESAGREAGDEVPEPAVPAMALTRSGRLAESEILDGDRIDVRGSSSADEPADRMTKLRVAAKARPGEVERDTGWLTHRVACSVQNPAGEMIGVEVDRHDPVVRGILQRYRR